MALSRKEKEQLVQEYGEKLGRAQVMIWAHYRGIDVGQMTRLRRQAQDAGAETIVVKNTLMRLALENSELPYDPEMMAGPCLVTFGYDDVGPAAKVVADFARGSQERLTIIGGIVGGQLVAANQVQALTDLPSREVLLAQVLGGVQAPVTGLVSTLSAVVRGVMNVLNARAEQLEGAEA